MPVQAQAAESVNRGSAADKDIVGETLRSFFSQVESEELPDRFKDLLKRLSDDEESRK